MKVELLSHTENPEKVIASAAKLCYSNKADIDSLMNDLTEEKVKKFVQKLESLNHESVFEHCDYTFGIEGVSRALLAQITRHRVGASFSVRSQRYCSEDNFGYVIPPSIQKHEKHAVRYKALMADIQNLYNKLVELGVPKEDARMILPNACETRMIVTMNVRELWHFFNLRCCNRAQWEIRELANTMLKLCREVSPLLFEHAGSACVKGYCPEGDMSCGKAPTMKELTSEILSKLNRERRIIYGDSSYLRRVIS